MLMHIHLTKSAGLRAVRLVSIVWSPGADNQSARGRAPVRRTAQIAALAGALLVGPEFSTLAIAHSWYEKECCDKGDCQPAPPGSVEYTDRGWLVRKGIKNPKGVTLQFNIVIPFDHKKVRPRPKEAGPGIDICTSSDTVFCLYLDSGS